MLEVGWSEIFVVAIVMILVVGPRELPGMLRNFGRIMTKMRTMAGEFRGQFEEAMKEADLDEVRKGLASAQKLNPVNTLREAIDPLRQMGQEIKSDLQKAAMVDTPAAAPNNAEKKDGAAPAATVKPTLSVSRASAGKAASKPKKAKSASPEVKLAAGAGSKPVAEAKPKAARSAKAAESRPASEKPVRKTTRKPAAKGDA